MCLHGSLGEKEPVRYLAVAHVVCDQARDLQLPSRKRSLSFSFGGTRRWRQLLVHCEGHYVTDCHVEPAFIHAVKLPLTQAFEGECHRLLVFLAKSLLKLQGARLPHVLGTAKERGRALMCSPLGCHPRKNFQERLQPRPIVKGMLAYGAIESLGLRELPLTLLPVGL